MEVRDQLLRLVRIQELLLEKRAAEQVVQDAPGRLEEIEGRVRERNAEYVAVRERYDALEADQRHRTGELETLEENRKKYMADLMQVQNQREYAAMLKEIDSVKSQISENEEAILKDMEEIETVKTDLESQESHIQAERKLVEEESAVVKSEAEAAEATIVRVDEERRQIESELPESLVAVVGRLEASRQGIFLSRALDGICQSCFVRVRPQVFQEIRQAQKVHACSNCRRLLYHEPTLEPKPGPQDSANEIEAVNGGAV